MNFIYVFKFKTVTYRADGPGVTIICYISMCISSVETHVNIINELLTLLAYI